MKIKATYTAISTIESDLDIDVSLLDSRIYTTLEPNKLERKTGTTKDCLLNISIETELDSYESVSECAMYARPRLLIIQGILSFLLQKAFVPFQSHTGHHEKTALNKVESRKFFYAGSDYLPYLDKIVAFLESVQPTDQRLFFSLIDRYRKALFLEIESEDSMVHDDEILLSYFHILELLAGKYYPQQKATALESINQFTMSFLQKTYLIEGNHLQSELNSKQKLVESILIPNISVGSKIMYMLNQQKLLTKRLKSFIAATIKDRNNVAHGKQVYQKRLIFPVPQFFPLIKNRQYHPEMIRVLSGRVIAIFLGLDHLKDKWQIIDENLLPTLEEIRIFLKDKRYKTLSIEDFYAGKGADITPYSLAYYLLNKKTTVEEVVPALSHLILKYRKIEHEITQIIMAVVLIVDIADHDLKEKCIDIIIISSQEGWHPDFKFRDILYYLEYLGHTPITLKELIRKREIH
jgi:hypothetical protein